MKLKKEFNTKRNLGKFTNTWKLNNTFLDNQWVKEKIRKIRKYFEMNENEDTTYHSVWGAAEVVLRGKLIAISVLY